MRELNFSIPSANKASVGITTALYDRRALDCTSTLPLINSLNNLAYLTTSSARIRDILTVDGGVERLVGILKEGRRSGEMLETWKWNLAFQCVVNVGVRGSEGVRTRVVEADVVPVIATILDNYIQVVEKCRERAEVEVRRISQRLGTSGSSRGNSHRSERRRQPPPPPIEIPSTFQEQSVAENARTDPTPVPLPLGASARSSSYIGSFGRVSHTGIRNGTADQRPESSSVFALRHGTTSPRNELSTDVDEVDLGLRPVREIDRLLSTLPTLQRELDGSSQPDTPITPNAPLLRPSHSRTASATNTRNRTRPSTRHHLSMSGSGESDNDNDTQAEESEMVSDGSAETVTNRVPHEADTGVAVQIQQTVDEDGDIDMEDIMANNRSEGIVADINGEGSEIINITHRNAIDGSIVNPAAMTTTTPVAIGFPPTQFQLPQVNVVNATPQPGAPQNPANWYTNPNTAPRLSRGVVTGIAAMPRDEDVLMSLQLLAYVSKYCNLRHYFQKSHLVPRLKIGQDIALLDEPNPANLAKLKPISQEELDKEWDEEFLVSPGKPAYNIFPLIEKFTARPSRHSAATFGSAGSSSNESMAYWAAIILRNLCRNNGRIQGVRQCAHWRCNRWESYPREFAKCRRCRRTKYCSKSCQKEAWGGHRFWCAPVGPAGESGEGESQSHRHGSRGDDYNRHHHHHHHPQHHNAEVHAHRLGHEL
ncbi:hypothetical protein BJ546DRAFT_836264 [Cryomyces antarcticus]